MMAKMKLSHARRPRNKRRAAAIGALVGTGVIGLASISYGGELFDTGQTAAATRASRSECAQPAEPSGNPGAGVPGEAEPGAGNPSVTGPGAAEPDVGNPGTAGPGAGEPGAVDPRPEEPNQQPQPVPEPVGQGQAGEAPTQGQGKEASAEGAPAKEAQAEEESAQEGVGYEAAAEGTDAPGGPCGKPNGRQPRGVWQEGPNEPSQQHPGAKFSPELYNQIAQMPNAQFVKLRNRIINSRSTGAAAARLKGSFYADGCSYPILKSFINGMVSQQTVDACLQHDFRYTVGPNTIGPNSAAMKRDKTDTDAQLGRNIGGFTGKFYEWGVWLGGDGHYHATPAEGDPIKSMAELEAILRSQSA